MTALAFQGRSEAPKSSGFDHCPINATRGDCLVETDVRYVSSGYSTLKPPLTCVVSTIMQKCYRALQCALRQRQHRGSIFTEHHSAMRMEDCNAALNSATELLPEGRMPEESWAKSGRSRENEWQCDSDEIPCRQVSTARSFHVASCMARNQRSQATETLGSLEWEMDRMPSPLARSRATRA